MLGFVPPPRGKVIRLVVVLAVACGGGLIPIEGLSDAGQRMLFIFLLAAGLWVTETIQPYATAILAVGLQVLMLGRPGGVLDMAPGGYTVFLEPIASPVIVLFFGGFILALGAGKYRLDRAIARLILGLVGRKPSRVLMGVIGVTAVFSMWMSNTATAAMMLAVILPLARSLPGGDPFRVALVLGIAIGANLGGMGTIIGSPPNGIAVISLSQLGVRITFLQWMLIAVPVMMPLLFLAWLLLKWRYPAGVEEVDLPPGRGTKVQWQALVVCGTFFLCVGLWMTEGLHGIPAAVVALIPVVVFTLLHIIEPGDLGKLDWHVLILVAGGISIGEGIRMTGLSAWLIGLVPFDQLPLILVMVAFALLAMALSNFMSNSAASALLIPIATSVAGEAPATAALVVALAATSAMSLPVSTPPNALAYASGEFPGRALLVNGTAVSLASLVLLCLLIVVLLRLGF